MALEYATDKPQGFRNHDENIAVVGAGGHVGKFIVEDLIKTGKHRVTAITRANSRSVIPDGALIKKVNYEDTDSLVSALQGQHVLIITMNSTAPSEQQTKLIEAAAAADVPFIMPNEWGLDNTNVQLSKDTRMYENSIKHRTHIEQLGKSSWIGLACGFWYEYSLSFAPEAYGFDFKNRAVTFFDEGTTRINTSTWRQCGRVVASLLSLKILPNDENDKSPHLTQFRNQFVYISSFLVSQKDMFDSVLRVTGTKPEDWKISQEPSKERYKDGVAELKKGNRMGFVKLMYTRVFFPDESGAFETEKGVQNEVLGLQREELDEVTKVAVRMAEEKGAVGH